MVLVVTRIEFYLNAGYLLTFWSLSHWEDTIKYCCG